QDHRNRSPQNLDVEPERTVVDVPDVERDALWPRQLNSAVHLRPARHPRRDHEAPALKRRVFFHLFQNGWPWPDQRHFTTQNVEQLRQFIDLEAAYPPADRCDHGMFFGHLAYDDCGKIVHPHAPELDQLKWPSAQPRSSLAV